MVFDMPAIYARSLASGVRVLIVEDEPFMAEAVRDGLRLEAIAADIAGDGEVSRPDGDSLFSKRQPGARRLGREEHSDRPGGRRCRQRLP